MTSPLDDLPRALSILLSQADLVPIDLGMSTAQVWRADVDGGPRWYLKTARRYSAGDLTGEVRRLAWLQGRLPVPEIVDFSESGETQYLLMSAVPGVPVHEEVLRDRLTQVIAAYAEALHLVHAVPIQSCPFDERIGARLAHARHVVATGAIRMDLLEEENRNRTPEDMLAELETLIPPDEDLVFTHGDYCTPNVLLDPASLALGGFVDWGNAGIAGRYQDLALAAGSIVRNFGPEWVQPFFEAYGIAEPDQRRIAFYKLLDEFY